MTRVFQAFEGCYEAKRAVALSGVPISTVYDWARKSVLVPSISQKRTKLWSYADLMALRVIYWLRHRKFDAEGVDVPASSMSQVRSALSQLGDQGLDIWRPSGDPHRTPLFVDRSGEIFIVGEGQTSTVSGQFVMDDEMLEILGPFEVGGGHGPNLVRPREHLRIVPGKLSGEPHLEHSRLTTRAVAALDERGFTIEAIHRLYPKESTVAISDAVDLERQLSHTLAA